MLVGRSYGRLASPIAGPSVHGHLSGNLTPNAFARSRRDCNCHLPISISRGYARSAAAKKESDGGSKSSSVHEPIKIPGGAENRIGELVSQLATPNLPKSDRKALRKRLLEEARKAARLKIEKSSILTPDNKDSVTVTDISPEAVSVSGSEGREQTVHLDHADKEDTPKQSWFSRAIAFIKSTSTEISHESPTSTSEPASSNPADSNATTPEPKLENPPPATPLPAPAPSGAFQSPIDRKDDKNDSSHSSTRHAAPLYEDWREESFTHPRYNPGTYLKAPSSTWDLAPFTIRHEFLPPLPIIRNARYRKILTSPDEHKAEIQDLALEGDGVVYLVALRAAMIAYPDGHPGLYSKLRQVLATNGNLSYLALAYNMRSNTSATTSQKQYADVFEAYLGAYHRHARLNRRTDEFLDWAEKVFSRDVYPTMRNVALSSLNSEKVKAWEHNKEVEQNAKDKEKSSPQPQENDKNSEEESASDVSEDRDDEAKDQQPSMNGKVSENGEDQKEKV